MRVGGLQRELIEAAALGAADAHQGWVRHIYTHAWKRVQLRAEFLNHLLRRQLSFTARRKPDEKAALADGRRRASAADEGAKQLDIRILRHNCRRPLL